MKLTFERFSSAIKRYKQIIPLLFSISLIAARYVRQSGVEIRGCLHLKCKIYPLERIIYCREY